MTSVNKNKCNIDKEAPTGIIALFLGMMLVMIVALWLIPNEILVKWSMWWNNIQ